MKTQIKLSTLVRLASKIEAVLGVSFRGTMNEMWRNLERVAGDCRTKKQAVESISEGIYNHAINGDYPATDSALLDVARAS